MKRTLVSALRSLKVLHRSVRGFGRPYDSATWWDECFYSRDVSDRDTIAHGKNVYSAGFHYASVEALICRALFEKLRDDPPGDVVDLGAGAGHWIRFYRELGARSIFGVEVSGKAYEGLVQRFGGEPKITLQNAHARKSLEDRLESADLVNAIGVMFHIVQDEEWLETLSAIARATRPQGLLVVSGAFGLVDGLDTQIDRQGRVNKRLRSAGRWKRALRDLGYGEITFYRNRLRRTISDAQPENHLLVARKGGS